MSAIDLRLYALIDPERLGGHEPAELTRDVVAGGATLLQLRDKCRSTKDMVETARAIRAAAGGVPLLINDRVDVALAAGADGVHVGQDDMAVADARRLLGPHAIIGLSIKSLAQAEAAPLDLLTYVAIGGVFVTTSKINPDAPVGIDGLEKISSVIRARIPRFPICAIAGIDDTNAAEVIGAGADGIAVISVLSLAKDAAAMAKRLRGVVDEALSRKVLSRKARP